MSRLVIPEGIGAKAAGGGDKDNNLERIAKYIPAEVLAFYTMWTQAAASMPWANWLLPLCVVGMVIGIVITFVYFDRFFPDEPEAARRTQRLISPIAFLVYGYTIMGAVVPAVFVSGVALAATALITLISAVVIPKG
jgi:hypothetical protein